MNLGERIRKVRKDQPGKLTQKAFGESLNISTAAVTSYELGNVIPPPATLKLICVVYNVNEEWLIDGTGSQYKQGIIPELVRALRNAPALLAALERLVHVMDDNDWKILNDVVAKAIQTKDTREP